MVAAESCHFQCAVNGLSYYHLMLKLVADRDSPMISEGLGNMCLKTRKRVGCEGRGGEGGKCIMLSKREHFLYGIRCHIYFSP